MDWLRYCNAPTRPAKSQAIRALDVLVIGPLMIWGGAKVAERSAPRSGARLAAVALAAFGATTAVYNGINYVRVARGEACG